VPIRISDNRTVTMKDYGRVNIPEKELAKGLRDVFKQMEKQFGPIQYEPIIKDYVPFVRQGLHDCGFCSIQQLNINGVTIDIDISFRVDSPQPALNIAVFANGKLAPEYGLVNPYFVAAEEAS